MAAQLPADKTERLRAAFDLFQNKRACTLKELQSIIGTQNFACKVIPPGRLFLQRMIELTRNISKPHYHIKFSAGCKFFKNLSRCGNSLIIVNWNGAKNFSYLLHGETQTVLNCIPTRLGRWIMAVYLGGNGFRVNGNLVNN